MENMAKDVMKGIAEGAISCLTGRESTVAETASTGIPVTMVCAVAIVVVAFTFILYRQIKK